MIGLMIGLIGCDVTTVQPTTVSTSSTIVSTTATSTSASISTSNVLPIALPALQSISLDPSCVPQNIMPDRSRLNEDSFGTLDEGNLGNAVKARYAWLTLPQRDVFVLPDTSCVLVLSFSNPGNATFEQVTINGETFERSAFLAGSNDVTIRLGFQTPSESGIVLYQIEEFRFRQNEIAYSIPLENRILRVAVLSFSVPTIYLDELTVAPGSVTFTATANDSAQTALHQIAVLYDGNAYTMGILPLHVGENETSFVGLIPGKQYQLLFVSIYDPFAHPGPYYLFTGSTVFTTPSPYEATNLEADYDSVSFDLELLDSYFESHPVRVRLYDQATLILTVDGATSVVLNELLSDKDYRVVVELEHEVAGERFFFPAMEFVAKTKTHAIPSFVVEETHADAESIMVSWHVEDEEGLGRPLAAGLKDSAGWIRWTSAVPTLLFENLEEDKAYTIHLHYLYDANDGLGERLIVFTHEIRTLAKNGPDTTFETIEPFVDGVFFTLSYGDYPASYQVESIECWDEDTLLYRFHEAQWYRLYGLQNDHAYTIKLSIRVNYRDGSGSWIHEVSLSFATQASGSSLLSWLGDDLAFGFQDIALSEPIEILTRTLTQNDAIIATDWTTFPLEQLAPNRQTVLSLTIHRFDETNGTLVNDVLSFSKTTPDYPIPSITISEITPEHRSMAYSFLVTDSYQTILSVSATLKDGETPLQTKTTTAGSFDGLWTGKDYGLEFCVRYDLRNGDGVQESCQTILVSTLAYEVPLFENVSLTSETFNVSTLYQETDPLQLGAIRAIELWNQDVLIASVSNVYTASFASLVHATEYTVVAVYAYDLQDGQGEQIIRLERSIQTLPKDLPILFIGARYIDYDSMLARLNTMDEHGVMTITSIKVYRGEVLYRTYDWYESEFDLSNLYSNEAIRFVVEYTVDLDDGLGPRAMTFETTVTTLEKITPTVLPTLQWYDPYSMVIRLSMYDSTDSIVKVEFPCQESSPCILSYGPHTDFMYTWGPELPALSLKVKVYYDLNDGFGVRVQERTYLFKNPYPY